MMMFTATFSISSAGVILVNLADLSDGTRIALNAAQFGLYSVESIIIALFVGFGGWKLLQIIGKSLQLERKNTIARTLGSKNKNASASRMERRV